ncbi:MAG: REP-associated tyrosine transposase [Terriglobia bacterium]
MSHIHRLLTTDRIFFVTVNLRRALAPLVGEEFRLLTAAMEESRRRLHYLLCGYVLMPDHWHALLGVGHPLTISRVAQSIKWMSARSLNGARKGPRHETGAVATPSGPVWQHQFWDRFVRHRKEFTDRLMYMHLNPVRKGLVATPEEWHWSSYNNYSVDTRVLECCAISVDYVMLPEAYRA